VGRAGRVGLFRSARVVGLRGSKTKGGEIINKQLQDKIDRYKEEYRAKNNKCKHCGFYKKCRAKEKQKIEKA